MRERCTGSSSRSRRRLEPPCGRGSFVFAACCSFNPLGSPSQEEAATGRRPRPSVSVTPGRDIETQIVAEVARAENILDELRPDNALDSPYLLSAVYYHDGIFDRFSKDRAEADPADRVVAHITRLLTPERKRAYIDLLRAISGSQTAESPPRFALPVCWSEPQSKRGRRRWRRKTTRMRSTCL